MIFGISETSLGEGEGGCLRFLFNFKCFTHAFRRGRFESKEMVRRVFVFFGALHNVFFYPKTAISSVFVFYPTTN